VADILLSLCIPTFNRCEILEGTLASIFSDTDFHPDLIEVIVSDNCSTDQTASIVAKYPLVRYYCNEVNIHAYNFERVLDYARGRYIRIVNDTFHLKKNILGVMLVNIKKHLNDDFNLFFYPNFRTNSNTSKEVYGIEEFFLNCSFYSTWSASTGFWRKDYEAVKKDNKYTELLFPQLHWMYEIVRNGKKTLIYFMDMYEVQVPRSKGGYNFFKTFVGDYLYIVRNQKIPFWLYEFEKYRLFRYHILLWMDVIYLKGNNSFAFEKYRANLFLFKEYWYAPYFYFFYVLLIIKNFIKKAHVL
jgi:abequosyltransferase